jgi:hypothetical protein
MKIIALMMEVVSTSETTAGFYQTSQRRIPEHSCVLSVSIRDQVSHPYKATGQITPLYIFIIT